MIICVAKWLYVEFWFIFSGIIMSRTEIATEELENDTSSSSGVTLALNGEPLLEKPEVERPSCVS